jgi:hypothetical protein
VASINSFSFVLKQKNSISYFVFNSSDSKQNKGSILKASVDYIKQLRHNADEYKKAEETNKYLNLLNNKLFNRIKELEFLCRMNGIPTLSKNENSTEYFGNPPMPYSISQQQQEQQEQHQSINDSLIHSTINSNTNEKKLVELKIEPMNDEPTRIDDCSKIEKKLLINQSKSYDSLSTSPSPISSSSSPSISSNSETSYYQTPSIKLITTLNKTNIEPTLTTLNSSTSQQQSTTHHQTTEETFL